MKIPQTIKKLLWEYDLDEIAGATDMPDSVIERVMVAGGWAEMRWLIHEAGIDRLRSYLDARGARVLPAREIAFWGLACSFPDALVREWVSAARERQAAWRG